MVEKPNNEKHVAAQAVATAAATHQERLQKIILSWDYSKLNADSQKFRSGKVAKKEMLLRRVGDTFKDVGEYLGVFEPLLLEEVKAQILRGEGEKDTGENVTEYQLAAVAACEKVNQFYSVSIAVKEDTSSDYQENDLLLLSEEKLQDGSNLSTYAFAMVERHDGKAILKLRMFFDGEVNDTNVEQFNQCTRLSKMLASLQRVNSFVWILKLSSLSTILREYSALRSVGSLPFSDIIFSAGKKHADLSSGFQSWSIPKRLMDYLESNHNESQLQAIQACLSRSPIVLIQGPPGTGKTQTILGLIGAVLHATPALKQSRVGKHTVQSRKESGFKNKLDHWMMASPWLYGKNPRDAIMPIDGDDGFYPTTGNDFKPEIVAAKRKHRVHILVCAPSNSALDEIVLRLLNTGIRDENGQVYSPSVVRVGLKPHHSVQAASMDYLLEQRSNTMEKSSSQGGGSVRDRDSIRAAILDEAAIVCSTLSFSGSSVFGRMNRGFDVVIIDEAAQAVEPATLVPLSHGCKQVFLVGDPIQLPATVLSTKADKFGYGMSLFKRFQQAGYPVQMLKTQYRMHPEIREFPSREFYSEALEDGEDVMHQTRRSWHEYRCFGPFSFFDINGKETQPPGSGSWINVEEAEWIIVLFRYLASKYPDFSIGSKIAVISPYKQQVNLIREHLRELLGGEGARQIDVNTIDGFQGREKDVAIFSCVRANDIGSIGFVSDFRRMNVGITRARSSMLVVGSATTLMKDEHWSNLINSAKERDRYFKVSKPYQLFFNAENLSSMRATATTNEGKERDEAMDNVNMPVNDTAAAEPAGDQQEQNDDDMDVDVDVGGDDDMDD